MDDQARLAALKSAADGAARAEWMLQTPPFFFCHRFGEIYRLLDAAKDATCLEALQNETLALMTDRGPDGRPFGAICSARAISRMKLRYVAGRGVAT